MARDDDDRGERRDYGKKGHDDSKEHKTEHLEMIKAGGESGDTGPTGSSRHYPKGKGSPHRTDWNPQKIKASTYGIDGVDCD